MVYKEIEIDSTWQQPLGEIRVIQEEADGRELRIYLYDNGSPLDLTGKTVSVYIQKPDNTMIYNSCEVEGNQATVTLTLQMMAVSGLTKLCELQIIDTDNHTLKVTLPPLRIIKSNYDGAIESTDEFSALAEQINAALTATKNANEAAGEARTTAATTAEATATTVINEQKGQPNGIATLDSSGNLVQMPSASDVGAVPTTRTVNGKALSSNISLTAADVGAVSSTGGSFTGTVNLTNANVSGTLSVSGTLNGIGLNNYLRQEYNKLKESEGTPTLNDIINGFGFCYSDSSDGAALNGVYLTVSGMLDNKYRLQLLGQYNGSNWLAYRTRNGDEQSWNPWHEVLTDNINAAISARHQYTSSSYPQIYGNGILQLGGDSRNEYGVVLRSNGTDEANAFRPSVNAGTTGHLYLGTANQKWRAVYAQNGAIQTSDRNAKHDITDLDPEKITAFIMGLKPSSYVFNDADSGRTHWGLISQDIEELFPQLGMTSMDFAGFIKSPKTEDYYEDVPETVTDEETGAEKTVTRKELKTRTVEGEYIYSLRYDEFISPLICMVQKQQRQIQDLERRLSALESKEEAK